MHALLAFLARPEGGTAKISREWAEASDWFVLFTLGTLLFLLGAFAMWAWLIWRRTTKPEPHVKLLMELEEEETERETRAPASREEPEPKAPWEQSPDWWKKADD
ncbi:hypothetical protein [Prosthecobacter sp.]|uniref:hypothetical protein n=1 Tax=Prosthecobacter sp. TaxID=1965333 RepID=UPI002AB94867|nr:hypothetical protein [Prosthecobacter sp.]MDZ4405765.1 hypothetical protein [Prosthecobacter sp.]